MFKRYTMKMITIRNRQDLELEKAVLGLSNVSDTDKALSALADKASQIDNPLTRFFMCIDQSIDLIISSIGFSKALQLVKQLHRQQVISVSDAHYICDKLSEKYSFMYNRKNFDFHSWLSN